MGHHLPFGLQVCLGSPWLGLSLNCFTQSLQVFTSQLSVFKCLYKQLIALMAINGVSRRSAPVFSVPTATAAALSPAR